jgi:hypothetical protein
MSDELLMPDQTSSLDAMTGAFVSSLKRNNKQIKEARAVAIAEDAQMYYKRKIEDIEKDLRQTRRDREAMLDLSPSDKNTIISVSDFDATKWVEKDLELGLRIRELEIKLEVASKQYNYLFR